MNPVARLFAGRGLVARLAIAALLLLSVATAALLLPGRTSYAATNGVMLTWDLSGQVDAASAVAQADGQLTGLLEQLRLIKNEVQAQAPEGTEIRLVNHVERRLKRVKRDEGGPATEQEEHVVLVSYLLNTDDAAVRDALRSAVAAKLPALPAPTAGDATWFSENGGLIEDGIQLSLEVNGSQRTFTFPNGASEDDIERTIRQWLAENNPDYPGTVDVEISGDGATERRVEVRIETHKES